MLFPARHPAQHIVLERVIAWIFQLWCFKVHYLLVTSDPSSAAYREATGICQPCVYLYRNVENPRLGSSRRYALSDVLAALTLAPSLSLLFLLTYFSLL